MNFRITGFDDIGSHTHYSINKVGEHYEVRADNYKCGRTVFTVCADPLQAYKMLEKIFLCVVFGIYADKERMKFIEKEIMKRVYVND